MASYKERYQATKEGTNKDDKLKGDKTTYKENQIKKDVIFPRKLQMGFLQSVTPFSEGRNTFYRPRAFKSDKLTLVFLYSWKRSFYLLMYFNNELPRTAEDKEGLSKFPSHALSCQLSSRQNIQRVNNVPINCKLHGS